jgi:hypothetical protein
MLYLLSLYPADPKKARRIAVGPLTTRKGDQLELIVKVTVSVYAPGSGVPDGAG